jgi:hypothetical protein
VVVRVLLPIAPFLMAAQDPTEKKIEEPKPELFFAGTVTDFNSEKLTVSRVVLGKTEKRVFRMAPDTKCEGKLKAKVRVTVRYIANDDGETAELIIVRPQQKRTQK